MICSSPRQPPLGGGGGWNLTSTKQSPSPEQNSRQSKFYLMATSALQDLLESIRSSATSKKDKGDKFERLMLSYFRTEPAYKRQFEKVWLWADWPDNKGKPDAGIDLVAKNSDVTRRHRGCLW